MNNFNKCFDDQSREKMHCDLPRIRILNGISGARQARGYAVIIDVMRAFTTACYAVYQGAYGIIPVPSIAEAFDLRRKNPDWLLMGERNGAKVDGFDLGNSPAEIKRFGSFAGRMVIQATSNGTRGMSAAVNAETVVTGSFVNAHAIVSHIRSQAPAFVDLVCMGTSAGPAVEDDLCGVYLANLIKEAFIDLEGIYQKIRRHPSTQRFSTSDQGPYPAADLPLCLSVNRFDFVLCQEINHEGRFILRPHFCR